MILHSRLNALMLSIFGANLFTEYISLWNFNHQPFEVRWEICQDLLRILAPHLCRDGALFCQEKLEAFGQDIKII